jgi:energy-coupling factor transporter ATP-binding protein EcfA2
MRFMRCKVSGHFVLRNSDWFTVAPECTVIVGAAGTGKTTLLGALRSVNPPACRPATEPFASFPRYVMAGDYTRKVLPRKKTAVIAVFECDGPLREKLGAIDPVYLENERIEVGRRLDNSRWLTFVEIAASSRWGELTGLMAGLRKLFPGKGKENDLAGAWRICDELQSTDRIKGRLAVRLNMLLDHVDRLAERGEHRRLVQEARFMVNRAERFRRARRTVEAGLPVFLHLKEDCLLPAVIDLLQPAEIMQREKKGCRPCVEWFFLELLGMPRAFLQQRDPDARLGWGRKDVTDPERVSEKLSRRLQRYLPEHSVSLSVIFAGSELVLKAGIDGKKIVSLTDLPKHHLWMLSCAVCVCCLVEVNKRSPVLLLDEPDDGLKEDAKREFEELLDSISKTCQLVICTPDAHFLADCSRRYRLQQNAAGESTLESLAGGKGR